MRTPFPQDIQLTAIAVAVQNREMIADLVLPRTEPLAKTLFRYQSYPLDQFFTVPDTTVGRRSRVNQVDFSGKPVDASTQDRGLEYGLPYADERDAPSNTNLAGMTTEWLMGLILLDREVRTAGLVFSAPTYQGNSEVVGAGNQFDNPNADPVGYILEKLDEPIMRPNQMVIGEREWRALRTNPNVVKAVHGNPGDKGAATKQQVTELFELERIDIGRGRVNTQKPGLPAEIAPCWRGNVALLYQNPTAARIAGTVEGGNVTFGFTAQTGTRLAGQWEDRNIGLRGGTMVRTGETVQEIVCAPSLGYLLEDVLAAP